jgi:hypothetical protein
VKRTARMFDDRATPRSPFVVAYSPRSHPDTFTSSSLSSTLRLQFAISIFEPLTAPRSLHAKNYCARTHGDAHASPLSENGYTTQRAKRIYPDLCRYKIILSTNRG